MNVVVVESPAKAKTINKYLGSGYTVLASYGHIRDLPAKDGSVRPDEDFQMDWEIDGRGEKHIRDIAQALKGCDKLFLATDPDREGEAISWHVREVLEARKVLKGVDVKRVVFNEVTKSAVLEAMANPRELNRELVEAYLARRALDYLVGFTLSPVLWRKLPGSRSAGRVQSVALRLICEREAEIEVFRAREYWSVDADFTTPAGEPFTAHLTHLDGTKLDKFDIDTEVKAKAAVARIDARSFAVDAIERKQAKRNPYPPFTTSTLQQEASRKLGFSARQTMQIAQRLYEGVDIGGETVGLITYMRTDAVNMANEAIFACRETIGRLYGEKYVPNSPRMYKTKAKNAQEAHEAIRPTDVNRLPKEVAAHLDDQQRRLYELIWKRTIACQMENALFDQMAVDVASLDRTVILRANGSVLLFDGFLKLYQEGRDDSDGDETDRRLPRMAERDALANHDIRPEQHFTQPPPRFSEASLVKRLEELGIGRPSTYASIISVLQDRNYVRLDKKRFIPEDRGRLVTAFLANFFDRYVQYNFTAELEEKLDDVSGGRMDWKAVLREFWESFHGAVDATKDLTITQVLDTLDAELGAHFFIEDANGHDPRVCPTCQAGRLSLKLGKFGAFIGCSLYPECRFTRPLTNDGPNGEGGEGMVGDKPLGEHDGQRVVLRKGPYGFYVQQGENVAKVEKKPKAKKPKKGEPAPEPTEPEPVKPKRVSLPRGLEPASIDLDTAIKLLALPRVLGEHPETQKPIMAGIGRFGPYIQHDGKFKSLERGDDVLTLGLNRAMDLLSRAKGGGDAKEVGTHPEGGTITLHAGRYGPYVKHGKVMASLPRGKETVTVEEAVPLLAAKAGASATKAKPVKKAAAPKVAKKAATATESETDAPAKDAPAKKAAAPKKPAAAKKPAAKPRKPAAKVAD